MTSLAIQRNREVNKYVEIYARDPSYHMSGLRMTDAQMDVKQFEPGLTYIDIGCGCAEMVNFAHSIGVEAYGMEAVESLCDGEKILYGRVQEMPFNDKSYDYSSMFDVIEHLIPGDDEKALRELERITRKRIVITANNKPSINKVTGHDLHINRRPYNEWDKILRRVYVGHQVVWLRGKRQYVSETWQIDLK